MQQPAWPGLAGPCRHTRARGERDDRQGEVRHTAPPVTQPTPGLQRLLAAGSRSPPIRDDTGTDPHQAASGRQICGRLRRLGARRRPGWLRGLQFSEFPSPLLLAATPVPGWRHCRRGLPELETARRHGEGMTTCATGLFRQRGRNNCWHHPSTAPWPPRLAGALMRAPEVTTGRDPRPSVTGICGAGPSGSLADSAMATWAGRRPNTGTSTVRARRPPGEIHLSPDLRTATRVPSYADDCRPQGSRQTVFAVGLHPSGRRFIPARPRALPEQRPVDALPTLIEGGVGPVTTSDPRRPRVRRRGGHISPSRLGPSDRRPGHLLVRLAKGDDVRATSGQAPHTVGPAIRWGPQVMGDDRQRPPRPAVSPGLPPPGRGHAWRSPYVAEAAQVPCGRKRCRPHSIDVEAHCPGPESDPDPRQTIYLDSTVCR